MFVDAGTLHAGGNNSQRASLHADDGSNHLSRTSLAAGMFGDFAPAGAFHEAVTEAHTHHTGKLRAHQPALSNVGDNARAAATAFIEMEDRNASELKAVRCNSGT